MKMTMEMLEKMGVTQFSTCDRLLEQFEELEKRLEELENALAQKEAALTEGQKLAAIERAILEADGKNARAILALVDMDEVSFDGKELTGLDLDAIREEAPYLFHEREERRSGTGTKTTQRKKEKEISAAFRRGLRR